MTRDELKNEIMMILAMLDTEESVAQVAHDIMEHVDKYDRRSMRRCGNSIAYIPVPAPDGRLAP